MPPKNSNNNSALVMQIFKMIVYCAIAWFGAFIVAVQSWDEKTTFDTITDKQWVTLWLGPTLLTLNTLKSYLSKPPE